MNAHDFTFPAIDEGEINLADYAGKTVLVVNTASACGLTPQYTGLQKLWQAYQDKGLVVLGVPSNDFGKQEPGSEAEIIEFCATNYDVNFPMTAKQVVIGGDAHPFYQWAVSEAGEDAAPKWNFHKYLISADGALAGVFSSKTEPQGDELISAIDAALAG